MKRFLLLAFPVLFLACNKEELSGTHGIVIQKGGCFSDSWLVEVTPSDQLAFKILCEGDPVPLTYTCTNSIFVSLPVGLAEAGKRIIFRGAEIVPACTSSSTAPPHVTVKRIWED